MIYTDDFYSIEIDLVSDLQKWAYNFLRSTGHKRVTLDRALYQYCNMLLRRLTPKPRKILVSKEFFCPPECKKEYEYFCDTVKRGSDLFPFMSKSIVDAEFKDKMIFDWGLFHFHLNIEQDEKDPRFKERADFLLIAYVDINHDDTMYFLQIRPHISSVWTEQNLINILADNWPEVMEPYRIKGAVSLTENVTDELYKKARKCNVCAPVDLHDGRVYLGPNLGLNAAGTSARAVMYHNRMCNDAVLFEKAMGERVEFIAKAVNSKLNEPVSSFRLELVQPGNNNYLFKVAEYGFLLRFLFVDEHECVVVGDNPQEIEDAIKSHGLKPE